MQQHPAGERRQERQEREPRIDDRERAAGEDRDRGRGVGERPQDLVGGADAATSPLEKPEPAIVGQPGGARRGGPGGRPGQCRPSRRDALPESAPARAPDRDRGRHGLAPGDSIRQRGVQLCRLDQLDRLILFLDHRLEKRQAQAGFGVESHRLRGDVLSGAAEHEGVQQIVGDELAGLVVVLGPPGCGDSVAYLLRESGALERHVAQDRHHVDHEGLALGPVQRLAASLVDERQ